MLSPPANLDLVSKQSMVSLYYNGHLLAAHFSQHLILSFCSFCWPLVFRLYFFSCFVIFVILLSWPLFFSFSGYVSLLFFVFVVFVLFFVSFFLVGYLFGISLSFSLFLLFFVSSSFVVVSRFVRSSFLLFVAFFFIVFACLRCRF